MAPNLQVNRQTRDCAGKNTSVEKIETSMSSSKDAVLDQVLPTRGFLEAKSKARKVLLLVNQLGGGGTERNVAMICRHLDHSRYLPSVWTLFRAGEFVESVRSAGVAVESLDRKWAYNPLFPVRLARRIAKANVDLIHCFSHAIAPSASIARVLWKTPTPMIYSEGTSALNRGLRGQLDAWSLRRFDVLTANSRGSRLALESIGFPRENVRLLPNGHDTALFGDDASQTREPLRAELQFDEPAPLAVFVGRLIATKRICDLIEAITIVRKKTRAPNVVVVGDGPERLSLERQISANHLELKVRLLGQRDDVVELLRSADLFLFPSEVEGLPNAVIEAALANVPIVACDIPGVRDVVGNDGAWLVPCRDSKAFASAVVQAMQNGQLAAKRAESAFQRAREQFAIQTVIERLCCIYDEVIDG